MRAAPLVLCVLVGCGDDGGPSTAPDAFVPLCEPVTGRPALGLQQVATGFDMPVFVTAPVGDPRLFVVEKSGAVRIIDDGGVVLPEPFLSVEVPGLAGLDDERGLLGLAFHPGFASNGRVFVFYTDAGSDTVVEEWHVPEATPNVADPASRQEVFFLDDFAGNHNGGTIAFGNDGFLYIGIGDGGGSNDPMEYGQNLDVAFGKMLRIDVATLPYTIPAGNPYADGGGLPELWALGLRNPYRWSFDRMTGDLYIGDVGQGQWEEIDVAAAGAAGRNYGWDDKEGAHCFEQQDCDALHVDPVYEWDQNSGDCSAIGGYVYRGCRMPDYHGTYFFADYCGSWVRSFEWNGADGYDAFMEWPSLGGGDIVAFGEDGNGELYIVRQDTGEIMRVVPQ